MPSEQRDPKLRPTEGDHLRRHKLARRVTHVWRNGYGFDFVNYRSAKQAMSCSLREWRKWAATAEVIHVAEATTNDR